ncbi:MAG: hypothetical protein ACE5JL_13820, partial [Dehalococcoidia bacterium]
MMRLVLLVLALAALGGVGLYVYAGRAYTDNPKMGLVHAARADKELRAIQIPPSHKDVQNLNRALEWHRARIASAVTVRNVSERPRSATRRRTEASQDQELVKGALDELFKGPEGELAQGFLEGLAETGALDEEAKEIIGSSEGGGASAEVGRRLGGALGGAAEGYGEEGSVTDIVKGAVKGAVSADSPGRATQRAGRGTKSVGGSAIRVESQAG